MTNQSEQAKGLTASELIEQERQRQISKEGWTIEHDDQHLNGELAKAADCYYEYAEDNDYTDTKVHQYWPWSAEWWKPKNQLRDYIRAGALYRAEKERLERTGGAVGQKLTNLRIGIRQCEIRIDEILKCEAYCKSKHQQSQSDIKQWVSENGEQAFEHFPNLSEQLQYAACHWKVDMSTWSELLQEINKVCEIALSK